MTTNIWLLLAKARVIGHDITKIYKGSIVSEDILIDAMMIHPDYEDCMWLEVDWGDVGQVIEVYIIVPMPHI